MARFNAGEVSPRTPYNGRQRTERRVLRDGRWCRIGNTVADLARVLGVERVAQEEPFNLVSLLAERGRL